MDVATLEFRGFDDGNRDVTNSVHVWKGGRWMPNRNDGEQLLGPRTPFHFEHILHLLDNELSNRSEILA